jgi:hypothetical protein
MEAYKSAPEATTRLAMLRRGEVDVACLLDTPDVDDRFTEGTIRP